jgi:23S rRNA (cytidine2498-2'-O)-methyltransferase
MPALHQIMLLCRPGFESECAAQMLDYAVNAGVPAYVKAKAGTGFAHIVSADDRDLAGLLTDIDFDSQIFTRQWFACTDRIDNLPEHNRIAPLLAKAQEIADQHNSMFVDVELAYADTNEGKSLSRFCKQFRPHLNRALKKKRLLSDRARLLLHIFFIDSSSAWVGVSPINNSAHDPMGIPRLRMQRDAPSRSSLKLDEAIRWFFTREQQSLWFKAGMHAVDLGAAPGGWSHQLVSRGLLVTAVDNGPMDKSLMSSGMVEHLRTDAFTYLPPARVEWLVCDMAERPLHVSRLIARWFTRGHCRAAIFNLKLPMKKRYYTVLECRHLLQSELSKAGIHHTLHIKQLYHDREEVTACLITATPELSR